MCFIFCAQALGAAHCSASVSTGSAPRSNVNRSARVERPFWFIERNFLAGRKFADWGDLNRQARQWCDRVNSTYKKHIRAVPRELFAVERPQLKPVPAWIPEVYRLHQRTVDVEGCRFSGRP